MNQSSYNVTDNDRAMENNENVSTIIFLILLFVAGIPALTNLSYIVVCFRIFSKEFNKLLILGLCFSGSILGFSTVWYSLLELFRSVLLTPTTCSFSIFLVTFGSFMMYSFLCILNVASYLTIRSYNFGVNQKLNRLKFRLFSGVLICSFCLSCSVWVIPHNPLMKTCDPQILFGKHFVLFIAVFHGALTILLFGTVITSAITILQIYYKFLKTTPGPNPFVCCKNKIDVDVIEVKSKSDVQFRRNSSMSFTSLNLDEINLTEIEKAHAGKLNNNKSQPSTSKDNTTRTSLFQCNNKQISVELPEVKEISIQYQQNGDVIEDEQVTKHQRFGLQTGHSSTQKNSRSIGKSWERRAFITNLIFSVTTVILTGPFTCNAIAIIALGEVPRTSGFVTFILFNVNSMISPFICAWRIQELRQHFKNICKKN